MRHGLSTVAEGIEFEAIVRIFSHHKSRTHFEILKPFRRRLGERITLKFSSSLITQNETYRHWKSS